MAGGNTVAPPWWRDTRFWVRTTYTYAIAAAAGYAASRIGVPLPWMLGPFFVIGALSAAGTPLAYLPMGREFAQLTVGLAVGLRFTPATLAATLALMPAMIAATVFVMAYTLVAALIFKPMAKVGNVTAFFATAAGGVADMAIIAKDKGGDAAPVAIVHALRVSVTVALVPIIVVTFGAPGNALPPVAEDASALIWLVGAFALSYGAVQLLKLTPLPNPWLVAPMFAGIAIGASGVFTLAVPWTFIIIAQIALGTWLGCRFRREILTSIPRVATSGIAVSIFMVLCAGAGAVALAATTTLPVTTAFLALAPAAVTEMAITAKIMHLDAEIVAAFHVMRIAIVCSTILAVYKIYNIIKGEPHGSRV